MLFVGLGRTATHLLVPANFLSLLDLYFSYLFTPSLDRRLIDSNAPRVRRKHCHFHRFPTYVFFFFFSCLFYSVWFHRGFYIFGAFSCIVFIGLGFIGVRYDLINSDQPEGLGSFFSSFTYFDLTLLEAWFWDLDLHIGSIWLDTYGHTYLLYFLFLILSPNKKE